MEVNDCHFNFSLFLSLCVSSEAQMGTEEKGKAFSLCGLPVKKRADSLKCTSEKRK